VRGAYSCAMPSAYDNFNPGLITSHIFQFESDFTYLLTCEQFY